MADQSMRVITRSSSPTQQDTAPYLTICVVKELGSEMCYYVQLSKDEEIPKWEHLGSFEEALVKLIDLTRN